jgi:Holliday junction resolvase
MGRAQRNKGANGERELARLLEGELGVAVTRNLYQVKHGGHDLEGLPVALEVKRAERLALGAWWIQTCENARIVGLAPCLAYRANRQPWTFRLAARDVVPELRDSEPSADYVVEMPLACFCQWVRERFL